MTLVPLPGATEAELVVKVGNSVVQGLRTAVQPSPWPDTREALLELHAILHEWVKRSAATARYAEAIVNVRGSVPSGATNVAPAYAARVGRDIRDALQGRIPLLQRLRGSSRRRASRRGLEAILSAYCPELLEQFESATTFRLNWVSKYRGDFDRWFANRTDAQVAELISSMEATHAALAEVERQLGEFIRVNFPLSGTTPGS